MTRLSLKRQVVAGGTLRRSVLGVLKTWLHHKYDLAWVSVEAYMQVCEFDPETAHLHCVVLWRDRAMGHWARTSFIVRYVESNGYTDVEYEAEEHNVKV